MQLAPLFLSKMIGIPKSMLLWGGERSGLSGRAPKRLLQSLTKQVISRIREKG